MTNLQRMGAGFLLASTALCCATMATAQIAPNAGTTASLNASPSAAAPPQQSGRSVLMRVRNDGTYESARAFSPSDDLSVISYDAWRALPQNANRPTEEVERNFQYAEQQNRNVCERAQSFVVRIEDLAMRYARVDGRYVELFDRTQDLRGSRVGSTWFRRGMGLLAIGVTGGLAAPGVLGYEADASASDRAEDVNRDTALNNIEHSRINVDHSLLTLEMDLVWVELVDPWCRQHHRPTSGS